jgi:hypothetical protein
MEDPHVPNALHSARELGLDIDIDDITYFLGARRFWLPDGAVWRGGAKNCSC